MNWWSGARFPARAGVSQSLPLCHTGSAHCAVPKIYTFLSGDVAPISCGWPLIYIWWFGAYWEEGCGLKSTLVYPGHETFIFWQLLLEKRFYGDGPNAFFDLRVSEWVLLIYPLSPIEYFMCHKFNIQNFFVIPTLYVCVVCGSQNKQRLFPYTALTDWCVEAR